MWTSACGIMYKRPSFDDHSNPDSCPEESLQNNSERVVHQLPGKPSESLESKREQICLTFAKYFTKLINAHTILPRGLNNAVFKAPKMYLF